MSASESSDSEAAVTTYQTCLLHSKADRAMRLVVSRRLEQFNVTMMEWLLMGVVQNGPKDGMTMSAVATALDVTLPQVTALTSRLTKLKFLKQKVSRQDRRSRRLAITTTGKKLLEETEPDVDEAMRQWTSNIPDEQLKTYLETLELLANRKPDNGKIEA